MLCDDLEGWGGRLKTQDSMSIIINAHSRCCRAESNTHYRAIILQFKIKYPNNSNNKTFITNHYVMMKVFGNVVKRRDMKETTLNFQTEDPQ